MGKRQGLPQKRKIPWNPEKGADTKVFKRPSLGSSEEVRAAEPEPTLRELPGLSDGSPLRPATQPLPSAPGHQEAGIDPTPAAIQCTHPQKPTRTHKHKLKHTHCGTPKIPQQGFVDLCVGPGRRWGERSRKD